ncbi:unnamed protein product, partial [marine sediment metagenome]
TLAELAREDRNVVAMDCDLGRSTRSYNIAGVDPNRYIEMGIAEQDMISTAAGMARCGNIFVTIARASQEPFDSCNDFLMKPTDFLHRSLFPRLARIMNWSVFPVT